MDELLSPFPGSGFLSLLSEPAVILTADGSRMPATNDAASATFDCAVGLASLASEPDAFEAFLRQPPTPGAPRRRTFWMRTRHSDRPHPFQCEASLLHSNPGDGSLILLRFLASGVTTSTERLTPSSEEGGGVSEDRFRLLVDSVRDYAIFMLDASGHVSTWNRGAQRIKGYAAEEIIGQHFSRFYPAADVASGKCERELAEASATGRFEDEGFRVRKDGSRFYANVVITALRDPDGNLVGFAKVTRDLTERKKQEQDRIARERAEEARRVAEESELRLKALAAELARERDRAESVVRVKDEFLATLSHELRTPLNAIVGWGTMLQNTPLDEATQKKAVDTIVRNAFAQNRLIDDLLDVSRIITGKLRLDIAGVDLGQIVAAAVDVVRPAADAKGVRLELLNDSKAILLKGDATRLQQVFWNLLANAVKFTPKDGWVRVALRRSESDVEIRVSDSGIGVSPEFLPHVFDRFAQQPGAGVTMRRTGGLGLGLAIVKHITELHGGTAAAASDGDGKGATFTVKLPGGRAKEATPATSAVPSSAVSARPLHGLHLLVIEDEPDSRELTDMILTKAGASVVAVASVREAFESLAYDGLPDAIVSDIGMPDEDGYSFIRRLRARPSEQGGRIPALALTAFARSSDRTETLRTGFQNHVAKPIEPKELVLLVANLTGRFS